MLTVASVSLCLAGIRGAAGQEFDERAAQLMDQYVQVTGGEEAYDAVRTRLIVGELSLESRGIAGTMVTYFQRPDKFYTEIRTPAGIHRRGSNGKTVWKIEPYYEELEGDPRQVEPKYRARILQGLERVLVIRDTTLDRFAHWRDLAAKLEYAGEQSVDGKQYAKVVLTYKPLDPQAQEKPVTIYLDLASGRIAQYTTAISRPEGLANVTAVLEDYREEDGVQLPHTLKLKTQALQYVVKLTRVENNLAIPPERFVLPREIQELLVKGQRP